MYNISMITSKTSKLNYREAYISSEFLNYALNTEFVDAKCMSRRKIKSPFEILNNFKTVSQFAFVK